MFDSGTEGFEAPFDAIDLELCENTGDKGQIKDSHIS